jgi:hypothetical protein
VGKLHVSEGIPISVGGGRLDLKSNKPEPKEVSVKDTDAADTEAAREERFLRHFNVYRSPEGVARRLADRIYSVQIHNDGTFRAVEVEPGSYILSFWIGDDFQHPVAAREVVVPSIPGGETTTPLDLGTVLIARAAPQP